MHRLILLLPSLYRSRALSHTPWTLSNAFSPFLDVSALVCVCMRMCLVNEATTTFRLAAILNISFAVECVQPYRQQYFFCIFQLQNYGRPNEMATRTQTFLIFSWLFGAVSACVYLLRVTVVASAVCFWYCWCFRLDCCQSAIVLCVARKIEEKLVKLSARIEFIYFPNENFDKNSNKKL